MNGINIHDYDLIGTAVWDNRELDDASIGTLKAEVVDSDELYLVLNYEDKRITFYVGLGLFEMMLSKAKVTEPQYVIFDSSVETVTEEEK